MSIDDGSAASEDAALAKRAESGQAEQSVPFYKRPRANVYKFERNDFERIPVVQHRFKPRPPYVPPADVEPHRLTFAQVTDGGQAQQAGIQLGDSLVRINDEDTADMSLADAHKRIEGADGELKLTVKKFDDEGGPTAPEDAAHEVSLGRRPAATLAADRAYFPNPNPAFPATVGYVEQPERKVWHPIVWQQSPPPVQDTQQATGQEMPHKRLIRNLHRFFKETQNNPELRQRHIEDMLLALPPISKDG